EDPWADMDPGNLPDIHFVVAWHDSEYIESPYAGPGTLTHWSPARYAIIDLHGQVLATLDAPDAPGAPYWTSTYDRRMLHPAGAGQFLGVTHGVFTEDGPECRWGSTRGGWCVTRRPTPCGCSMAGSTSPCRTWDSRP
ncbi:MAG: hypothetical protein JRJ84_25925, partial [Deltaproteobacteria bacterium]|nr:hypothetical protein [Deltaproteobacteria bacterium]